MVSVDVKHHVYLLTSFGCSTQGNIVHWLVLYKGRTILLRVGAPQLAAMLIRSLPMKSRKRLVRDV